jgi:hypothetical protein
VLVHKVLEVVVHILQTCATQRQSALSPQPNPYPRGNREEAIAALPHALAHIRNPQSLCGFMLQRWNGH